ncbi:TolC family protein [Pseudomonas gingeri]|uniref:TolC family protein n=1 Tax=Pseudomonas gingeri TaxID=117681 RepID=UPI00159F8B20|nr:TolC family protein [Pseudomonas gingeri]NWD66977.1 TolC family protein [Pseudomonas gingeri]NWD73727.1 TolC family protein [Pseudomonas gingeri]
MSRTYCVALLAWLLPASLLASETSSFTSNRADLLSVYREADAFEQLVRLTNHEYVSIEGVRHQLPVLSPVPEDAKLWVDTAVKQNLKLQASNLAVQTAEETLHQRQAGHAPTMDAVASYRKGDNDSFGYSNPSDIGRNDYGGNVAQSSIAVEVSIPLYSGGRVSSQAREAYKRLSQSEEQREGQRREVVLNTRNFYRAMNSDIEQIRARKKTILSAQGSLKATKVGADIGIRNTVYRWSVMGRGQGRATIVVSWKKQLEARTSPTSGWLIRRTIQT